jgi:OHCU decarboxylase
MNVFGRLAALNAMAAGDAERELLACCGSTRWAGEMAAARPFPDAITLMITADRIWRECGHEEWLEAFAAHPRIGARPADGAADEWAAGEQAGVASAEVSVLSRLAAGNQAYAERFGFIFIVCATGKSAAEMLALLEARQHNEPEAEAAIAAEEQRKITRIRVEKWLTS